MKKEEIAFKNFKKSVSKSEFKAVLRIAKEEYESVKDVLNSAKNFEEKSMNNLLKDSGTKKEDLPDGFLKKITENLIDKARAELVKLFGRKFNRIESITSFINRFQKPGEEYPDLDFDFIKYKLNNK